MFAQAPRHYQPPHIHADLVLRDLPSRARERERGKLSPTDPLSSIYLDFFSPRSLWMLKGEMLNCRKCPRRCTSLGTCLPTESRRGFPSPPRWGSEFLVQLKPARYTFVSCTVFLELCMQRFLESAILRSL